MSKLAYLELRNHQPHPVQLFIEPWCEEYFLLPETEVTLEGIGEGAEIRSHFELDVSQYQWKVWAGSGVHEVRVSQNSEPLEVGHNAELWERFCREAGVDPSSACKLETVQSKVALPASPTLERVR